MHKKFNNSQKMLTRRLRGIGSALLGILLNALLCLIKLVAGSVSGSVAITTDAYHNLTDAFSSVVTLIGFLPKRSRYKNFPLGLGRGEYIAGAVVSGALVFAGFSLLTQSIKKFFSPKETEFSGLLIILMLVAVCVKIFMALFYKRQSSRLDSASLKAAYADCLCDSLASFAAAAAVCLDPLTELNIDAMGGGVVSAFMLLAGIKSLTENIKTILGKALLPEDLRKIKAIISDFHEVSDYTEPILHDYGTENKIVTFKVGLRGEMSLESAEKITSAMEKIIGDAIGAKVNIGAYCDR